MGVLRLLTSDLAFDLCYHARLQRDDGESLRVSRVWEVRPGLLFSLAPDVHDKGFMVRLADSEQHSPSAMPTPMNPRSRAPAANAQVDATERTAPKRVLVMDTD